MRIRRITAKSDLTTFEEAERWADLVGWLGRINRCHDVRVELREDPLRPLVVNFNYRPA